MPGFVLRLPSSLYHPLFAASASCSSLRANVPRKKYFWCRCRMPRHRRTQNRGRVLVLHRPPFQISSCPGYAYTRDRASQSNERRALREVPPPEMCQATLDLIHHQSLGPLNGRQRTSPRSSSSERVPRPPTRRLPKWSAVAPSIFLFPPLPILILSPIQRSVREED
ncbi:hypothetical protein ARMGADRAFT_1171933 [Armillaria gallica]|uniref:Uncharacterized protein n=1 Tax=Armillaria gallica TaxID=47427 RepID=A0A2H3CW87_ARMGA|nr:hypothetical protein ARMGADRAFT_1171933 [Armillaria gallica]